MTPPKVAVVMSRFPKLTETFVLEEIRALERAGVPVVLYPLLRERTSVVHPNAVPWVARARYLPFVSWPIVRSQLWFLRHRPVRYLGMLAAVLRGTWGSRRFLVGALGILPKVVHASRRMEGEGVSYVHCHFASHPALAGFIVHRLTGIPFGFTAHGSDLHRDRHMLPQKAREAALVVTISEDNRDLIAAECDASVRHKLHVVGCGVDTGVLTPAPPGPRTGPLRVVAVGTLHEVKGQCHLLDALARVVVSGVDVRCDVIGDGPDRSALETQARVTGLGGVVRFRGSLTAPEVRTALHESDVLVAPSVPARDGRREGIPVVLMEAMACGLPVVASRLSGIPELIDDGVEGILVEPADVEGLATALKRLGVDAPLRRRMGRAGRARIERDHDVDINAATLARLFTAAAG